MKKLCAVFAILLPMGCAANNNNHKPPAQPKLVTGDEAAEEEKAAPERAASVLELAASDPSFSTLVAALKAAELEETLGGEGPFTIFAPTNAAFAKLPPGTLATLMADKDKLKKILTHHVVPGELMAKDVTALGSATMLDGTSLPIDTTEGVKIGGATVEKTDLMAKNGVIHAIDTVLIPE